LARLNNPISNGFLTFINIDTRPTDNVQMDLYIVNSREDWLFYINEWFIAVITYKREIASNIRILLNFDKFGAYH
jgi:hypothetical protein